MLKIDMRLFATSTRLQDKWLKIILDQDGPQEGQWPSRRTDLRHGLVLRIRRVHGAWARAQSWSKKMENL